jgi:hypothetical protein
MRKALWRTWAFVRHVLSIRGLLQWTGWWETVTAGASSVALAIASRLNGLAWPITATIAIVVFAAVSVIWRVLSGSTTPDDRHSDGDLAVFGWGVGGATDPRIEYRDWSQVYFVTKGPHKQRGRAFIEVEGGTTLISADIAGPNWHGHEIASIRPEEPYQVPVFMRLTEPTALALDGYKGLPAVPVGAGCYITDSAFMSGLHRARLPVGTYRLSVVLIIGDDRNRVRRQTEWRQFDVAETVQRSATLPLNLTAQPDNDSEKAQRVAARWRELEVSFDGFDPLVEACWNKYIDTGEMTWFLIGADEENRGRFHARAQEAGEQLRLSPYCRRTFSGILTEADAATRWFSALQALVPNATGMQGSGHSYGRATTSGSIHRTSKISALACAKLAAKELNDQAAFVDQVVNPASQGIAGVQNAAFDEQQHGQSQAFVIQWKAMLDGLNLDVTSRLRDPIREARLSIVGGKYFDETHQDYVVAPEFDPFSGIDLAVDAKFHCGIKTMFVCVQGKKGDSQVRIRGFDPKSRLRPKQLAIRRPGKWRLDVRLWWPEQNQIDIQLTFLWDGNNKPVAANEP